MQPQAESDSNLDLIPLLQRYQTESGRAVLDLLDESPILLVFLRHFGCSFCREALDRVAAVQNQLHTAGVQPVFIHLGTPERAKPYFDFYNLSHVERVSNPDASLYTHPIFGLRRAHPLSHFLLPSVWLRWVRSAIPRYGIGLIHEDAHQMPGVFFLRDRKIVRSFQQRVISDQPDYLKLIS